MLPFPTMRQKLKLSKTKQHKQTNKQKKNRKEETKYSGTLYIHCLPLVLFCFPMHWNRLQNGIKEKKKTEFEKLSPDICHRTFEWFSELLIFFKWNAHALAAPFLRWLCARLQLFPLPNLFIACCSWPALTFHFSWLVLYDHVFPFLLPTMAARQFPLSPQTSLP